MTHKILFGLGLFLSGTIFSVEKIQKSMYGAGFYQSGKITVEPRYYDVTKEVQKEAFIVEKNEQGKPQIMFPHSKIPQSIVDPNPHATKQLITQFDDGTSSYIQIDYVTQSQSTIIGHIFTTRIIGPTKIARTQRVGAMLIQAIWGGPWEGRGSYHDVTSQLEPLLPGDPKLVKTESIIEPYPGVDKQLIIAYDVDHERKLAVCFTEKWAILQCIVNGNLPSLKATSALESGLMSIPATLTGLGIAFARIWYKMRQSERQDLPMYRVD
jgi:hypothetical protein